MIEVHGKYGVYAKVLKHSISPQGINLLTFEVSYPRIILAELNTHGMVCKNSSSSRAIPFAKMAENLKGKPIRFGANQAGMQDKGEDFDAPVRYTYNAGSLGWISQEMHPETLWDIARQNALDFSEAYFNAGYHKQVYNRLTEPFQMMKTVLTATEYANLFWLRDHEAADPSLAELARCMREAAEQSTPELLHPGEWHLPYVDWTYTGDDSPVKMYYILTEDNGYRFMTLEEAIKVSSARCAAVSFRNVDYGVEKSTEVYNRLVGDLRKHGSAFQHQATPIQSASYGFNRAYSGSTWEQGITHADRDGQLWSAQFRGWIMHRKLIPGENVPGFLVPKEMK